MQITTIPNQEALRAIPNAIALNRLGEMKWRISAAAARYFDKMELIPL